MSLEDEIKKLMGAVERLTSALEGQSSLAITPEKATVKKAAPAKKVMNNDPEPEADEEVEQPKKAAPKAAAKAAPKKEEPVGLTYDEIREKSLTFSKVNGREALISALTKFGVTKATELKEEQYEEYAAHLDGAEEDLA